MYVGAHFSESVEVYVACWPVYCFIVFIREELSNTPWAVAMSRVVGEHGTGDFCYGEWRTEKNSTTFTAKPLKS